MVRTVYYALRAHASHNAGARNNESLETYLQTTLAGGFISLGMDLMQLTRALLVNATKGSAVLVNEAKENKNKMPDWGSDESLPKRSALNVEGFAGLEDLPNVRKLIRQIGGAALALFWVTIILGIISGVDYQHALHSGAQTDLVRLLWYVTDTSFIVGCVYSLARLSGPLRYINAGFGLFLLIALAAGAVWACIAIPRVPRSSVSWIVLVAALAVSLSPTPPRVSQCS